MKSRHNFTLSPEAIAILRALAEKNGVSMSAMLEIIIRKSEKSQSMKNSLGHTLLRFDEKNDYKLPGSQENPMKKAVIKHPETQEEIIVHYNTRTLELPRQWEDAGFEWFGKEGWVYNWTENEWRFNK